MGELKDEGVEIHVIDLGDYNLKGLGAPEHLFVVCFSLLFFLLRIFKPSI